MKHPLTVLAFLLSALLLTSCGHGNASGAPGETSVVIPVVPVVKVAEADLSNDITLSAEFVPYQEVDVMSKVAGYIRSIRVDIGDRVHAGELLATLEVPEMQDDLTKAASAIQVSDSEVSRAHGDLQRAQSAHEIAHLSYTRINEVSQKEKGLVPQQEVDEAHSRDLQSEAQLAAAQSNLKASQQNADMSRAEQGRVKTMFQYTAITAPFEGVVTKRYASVGSMIQAGTASQTQAMPVIRISQNNLLRLMLPIPESSVSAVHIGQSVDVSVPTLHRVFSGRVTRFAETLRMSTRTMDTEVDVPNPSLRLIPGMYAEVQLTVAENKNAISVPLDGLEGSGDAARAYVVTGDGTVRIVHVTTGIQTAQRIQIRAGLSAGDEVIVGRHAGLIAGQKVQPRVAAADVDAPPKSKAI